MPIKALPFANPNGGPAMASDLGRIDQTQAVGIKPVVGFAVRAV